MQKNTVVTAKFDSLYKQAVVEYCNTFRSNHKIMSVDQRLAELVVEECLAICKNVAAESNNASTCIDEIIKRFK